MKPDAETRAAEYRARAGRMVAFRSQLRAQLAGDPAARLALADKTNPLIAEDIPDGPEPDEPRYEPANG